MTEMVSISMVEFQKFQKLKAQEAKMKERKKPHNLNSLAKLLEKKANSDVPIHVPTNKTKSTERVLRHIAKNRDEYNAKRRERRRMQKEAMELALEQAQPVNPQESG